MKTWLITGCSSGIGRGIARAVLEKGDNAVVTARTMASVKELIQEYPTTAIAVTLDITKKEDIKKAVKKAVSTFGKIDVLVNNAGYGYRSSVEEGEIENVDILFNTNFFGPIELIKEVLPQMRTRKSGAIINISSIAAMRSGIGSGYYAASKAALELMSDALHKELMPLGIKVMIAQPGAFRTNFYDTSLKGTQNKIDDYAETAWKTRKENITNTQNQPGDPNKAGKIIVEVMEADIYPKRLLLGSDAIRIVSAEVEDRIKEIDNWKDTSSKSDF